MKLLKGGGARAEFLPMSHPLTDAPRLRPALRIMIRALLALFLVDVAALVVVNRGAMGGIVPVIIAVGSVLLLVVAPLIWEGLITARAMRYAPPPQLSASMLLSHDHPAESGPVTSGLSSRGHRAWTAPRPSIWTQTPQPRDWFAHRTPRLARWP